MSATRNLEKESSPSDDEALNKVNKHIEEVFDILTNETNKVRKEKDAFDPGGVLPYMGYIGTCRGIGYGFWRVSILK